MGNTAAAVMAKKQKRAGEYTRIGICNGAKCREEEKLKDVPLWKLGDDRWRCARCYKDETGYLP